MALSPRIPSAGAGEPVEAVIEELNRVGLKATAPRLRVLEVFHSDERRHLSAEDVYRRVADEGSDIGLGTIYRVLAQLTDVGVLLRSVFDPESGKAVFELYEGKHHDHLVCLDCGRVDEFVDELIEKRQRTVAEQNGYSLAPQNLALYGYCAECRGREPKQGASAAVGRDTRRGR